MPRKMHRIRIPIKIASRIMPMSPLLSRGFIL